VKNLTGRGKINKYGACEEVEALEAVFQKYSVIYDHSYIVV
jgi:hypothetical protein